MDELVRLVLREIALGGLSGVCLSDLWPEVECELNIRKEETLPVVFDISTKGILWRELLYSSHLSHYQSSLPLPSKIEELDQKSIIHERGTNSEDIIGALGIRKNGWVQVDIQSVYLSDYQGLSRRESRLLAQKQVQEVENKGKQYVLVASQMARNRALGLYGGGKWKYPTLRVDFPKNPITSRTFEPLSSNKRISASERKRQQRTREKSQQQAFTEEIGDNHPEMMETNETVENTTEAKDRQGEDQMQEESMDIDESNEIDESKRSIPVNSSGDAMEVEGDNDTEKSDNEEPNKQGESQEKAMIAKTYITQFEYEFIDGRTYSDIQYCVLELIGKQRRKGLQQNIIHTIGKGKLAHCVRKLLHRDSLDRSPVIAVSKGKALSTQILWVKNMGPSVAQLQNIREFHPALKSKSVMFIMPLQYHVCSLLDAAPGKTAVEREVGIYYRANVVGDSRYRWGTLLKSLAESGYIRLIQTEIPGKEKPVPCIQLVRNIIDEYGRPVPPPDAASSSPWASGENDEDEDSSSSLIPMGMDIMRYIFQLIEDSGTKGITHPQIQKITNIPAKFIGKQTALLSKHYHIKSIAQHTGKQVTHTLYTKENYEAKIAACNIQDAEQIGTLGDTTRRTKEELPKPSPKDVANTADAESIAELSSPRKITLQRLQRKNWLIDIVQKEKIIATKALRSYLRSLDPDSRPDSKHVRHLVSELVAEGKIKRMVVSLPVDDGKPREMLVVMDMSITEKDEIFKEFIRNANNQLMYHKCEIERPERPTELNLNVRKLILPTGTKTSDTLGVATTQGYFSSLYIRSRLLHSFLLEQTLETGSNCFRFADIYLNMSLEIFAKVIGITKIIPHIESLFQIRMKDLPGKIKELVYRRRSFAQRLQILLTELHALRLIAKNIEASVNVDGKLASSVEWKLESAVSVLDRSKNNTIQTFTFQSAEDIMSFWERVRAIALVEIRSQLPSKQEHATEKGDSPKNLQETSPSNSEVTADASEDVSIMETEPELPEHVVDLRTNPRIMNAANWVYPSLSSVTNLVRAKLRDAGEPKEFKQVYLLAKQFAVRPQQVIEYYRQLRLPKQVPKRRKKLIPKAKPKRKVTRRRRRTSNANKARRSLQPFTLYTAEHFETDYEYDPLAPPPPNLLRGRKSTIVEIATALDNYTDLIIEEFKDSSEPIASLMNPQNKSTSFWEKLGERLSIVSVQNITSRIVRLLFHSKHRLSVSLRLNDALLRSGELSVDLPDSIEQLNQTYNIYNTFFIEDRDNEKDIITTEQCYANELVQQLVLAPEKEVPYHQLHAEIDAIHDEIIKPIFARLQKQEVISKVRPDRTKQFEMMYSLSSEAFLPMLTEERESPFYIKSYTPQFFYCVQFIKSKLTCHMPEDTEEWHSLGVHELSEITSGATAAAVISLLVNHKITIDIETLTTREKMNKEMPPLTLTSKASEISFPNDPIARFEQFGNVEPIDCTSADDKLSYEGEDLFTCHKSIQVNSIPDPVMLSSAPSIRRSDSSLSPQYPVSMEISDESSVVTSQLGKRKEREEEVDEEAKGDETVSDVGKESQKKQKRRVNSNDSTADSNLMDRRVDDELNRFDELAKTAEIDNTLKHAIKTLFCHIFGAKEEGIAVSTLQDYKTFSTEQDLDVAVMTLRNFKMIMALIKADLMYYVANVFIDKSNKWVTLTKDNHEVVISPWTWEASLNAMFVRGAYSRVLRFVIQKPGISTHELIKKMILLSTPRVWELLTSLYLSSLITWKFAKPNRVSLFSTTSSSISYTPSVSKVQELDPQYLFLLPTPQVMMFSHSSLFTQS